MSALKHRRVAFVCRSATGEGLRSAKALKSLADQLFCISEQETEVSGLFTAAIHVANVHDTAQLISALRELTRQYGAINHIVTAQETLLEPVAKAREALNVAGMSSATVRRALDKSLLKSTLRRAGIATPADKLVTSTSDAVRCLSEVGFPVMLKPLSGSGALATLLIRTAAELKEALALMQPSPGQPILAEVCLQGQELCIDTIAIDNEPRCYSICCYYPSILEALANPATQWACVMPRAIDVDLYADFIEAGLEAVRALAVGNSFTHMEGFLSLDGKVLGFHDATLRPAGARIGPMFGLAYDVDLHRAWARCVIDGRFDGPWERKFAVGTIFLRGSGAGVVEHIDGIEIVKGQLAQSLVDVHWPIVGARKSETYTGDGYLTVRHESTEEVKQALAFIEETVRLGYSEAESTESALQWQERFRNYKQLNRPSWEAGGLQ